MDNEQFAKVEKDLVNRLASLNYIVESKDDFAIRFCADKAFHKVTDACNLDEIPDGLYEVFIDIACGEFLFFMNGTLTEDEKKSIVKRITEGENTIEFDTGTNVQKIFDSTVKGLRECGNDRFSKYRVLVW